MNSSWVIDTTLYLLTFMSFLSWSIFLAKMLAAWRSQRATVQYLATQWQSPHWQAVNNGAHSQETDLAKLSYAGLAICHECANSQYTTEELYAMVSAGLGQEINHLTRERESWLGVLASVSSIAPFVGLFGTVWGIMHALVVIGETGQATIAVVAGPIGEALIATAIGIATAVPALIFYNVLMRNTRLHVTQLESFAERFLRFALKHRAQWSGT
ncbi:MAG: MotA/TolQ/ExbB proton channel family protein [Limnohabitans sp.]